MLRLRSISCQSNWRCWKRFCWFRSFWRWYEKTKSSINSNKVSTVCAILTFQSRIMKASRLSHDSGMLRCQLGNHRLFMSSYRRNWKIAFIIANFNFYLSNIHIYLIYFIIIRIQLFEWLFNNGWYFFPFFFLKINKKF